MNTLNNSIIEAILEATTKSIPKSTQSKNKELPAQIVNLIKSKRKARRTFFKTRKAEDKDKFNLLHNQVKTEIKAHRNKDWSEFIARQGPNPQSSKPFWKKINSFRTKPSSHHMPTIIDNGVKYSTSHEKAELFSEHLAKVFNENNEPGFDDDFKRQVEAQIDTFDFTVKDSTPFTIHDLENAIKSLNNKSTQDPQGICNRLLKNLSAVAKKLILSLFNQILLSSELPLAWKLSKIHMIKKKADSHTTLKSFRPISLTSCLCKLNERLIQIRLLEF